MIVTKEAAEANPLHHAFNLGEGYVRVGAPAVRPRASGNSTLELPQGLQDGEAHWLSPPGGGRPIRGVWLGATKAWRVHNGNRLAFTNDYLSAHGWLYLAPCKPNEPPPIRE